MFLPAPELKYLAIDPQGIVALYHSVNATSVLLPGRPSQNARAVIVGHRPLAFAVHVALHFPDTGEHLVYKPDEEALDAEGARQYAQEAIQFAESMGFFMENLNWRDLDPVQRPELLASLKVFQPPVVTGPAADERRRPLDPRTKLARLLVQL